MKQSKAFVIPGLLVDLPADRLDQWRFACASLERINARIVEAEAGIEKSGTRMRSRAGGLASSPESRALAKAIKEGDRVTGLLIRLLGHVREPAPPKMTIEDLLAAIAELDADDCGGEEGGCPGCDLCVIEFDIG